MVAYIIAEIEVTDPEAYEEYKKLTPQSIAAYGGKYLVRGGAAGNFEGDWQPKRVIITEWESVERGKEWHDSEAYPCHTSLPFPLGKGLGVRFLERIRPVRKWPCL